MHHERLVESPVRDRAPAVADVQEGCLRQRGEQLVRRVRREDRRALVVLRVAPHAEPVAVDRVEPRVAVPGLVPVDAVDRRVEQLLDGARVVAEPVVGRVRDHAVDRTPVRLRPDQRVRLDRPPDRRGPELVRRDRPDDAVAVAQRHVVVRDRPRHREAVLDRLVAIAVAQRDLAGRHRRHEDDAVRRRRAVGHAVGAVGAEHARGVLLRLADRPGVVEQRPELADRDRQVGAQQPLAKVVVEHSPDRRLEERGASGVPRRVPRILVNAAELAERRGHRRQHLLDVPARRRLDTPAHERRGVLEHPDELVGELHHVDR